MIYDYEPIYIKSGKNKGKENLINKILLNCDLCESDFKGILKTWKFKEIHKCPRCLRIEASKSAAKRNINNKDRTNNPTYKEYWISKGYSIEAASIEIKKRRRDSYHYWIAKGYLEHDAKNKARAYALSKNPLCKEYWIAKGYSEYDANKLADDKVKSSNIYNQVFKRNNNILCKEYWIDRGYSEHDANIEIKKIQYARHKKIDYDLIGKKNSLFYKSDIGKSVVKKMKKKVSDKLKSKNKTHSPIFVEYWLAKGYSEEDAKNEVKNVKFNNTKKLSNSSKIENKFFDELHNNINLVFNRQNYITIDGVVLCPDGKYEDIIIEFNGTSVHLDKRFYNETSMDPWGRDYTTVWDKNVLKEKLYIKKNYFYIVVWENDYKKHKIELFNVIKEKIKNADSFKGTVWDSSSVFN